MRLKVSPKEALLRLDALVQASHHRAADIDNRFRDVLDESRERHWKMLKDESIPITEKNENMDVRHVPLSESDKRELDGLYNGWLNAAVAELRAIFQDYVPVYTFLKHLPDMKKDDEGHEVAMYRWLIEVIEAKNEVLMDYYHEVEKSMKSPLAYIPDKAQICLYDFVCSLSADTNEATLCAFMFRFSVGEKVEMLDAYDYITGKDHAKLDPAGRRVITHAYDGINRKTNEAFGFPVLKKSKTLIALNLPSRFLRELPTMSTTN